MTTEVLEGKLTTRQQFRYYLKHYYYFVGWLGWAGFRPGLFFKFRVVLYIAAPQYSTGSLSYSTIFRPTKTGKTKVEKSDFPFVRVL